MVHHMHEEIFNSVWLGTVQFWGNTVQKKGNIVQIFYLARKMPLPVNFLTLFYKAFWLERLSSR